MKELEKNYNPAEIEGKIYQKWLDRKYFHAEPNPDKKPFTIVMPPPNITGQLHMGHALDNTMQDILIRYKRMQGYEALWQPGTDHAAIATEVKVIESLKKQGIDKEDLGRDGFPADALSTSCIRWDPPQTGTENVLPWTRAVRKRCRKYLSVCMRKAIFTRGPESSTGARYARPPYRTQR